MKRRTARWTARIVSGRTVKDPVLAEDGSATTPVAMEYRVEWKDGHEPSWIPAEAIVADVVAAEYETTWCTAAKKADRDALLVDEMLQQVTRTQRARRGAPRCTSPRGWAHAAAMRTLQEVGADPKAPDRQGRTLLELVQHVLEKRVFYLCTITKDRHYLYEFGRTSVPLVELFFSSIPFRPCSVHFPPLGSIDMWVRQPSSQARSPTHAPGVAAYTDAGAAQLPGSPASWVGPWERTVRPAPQLPGSPASCPLPRSPHRPLPRLATPLGRGQHAAREGAAWPRAASPTVSTARPAWAGGRGCGGGHPPGGPTQKALMPSGSNASRRQRSMLSPISTGTCLVEILPPSPPLVRCVAMTCSESGMMVCAARRHDLENRALSELHGCGVRYVVVLRAGSEAERGRGRSTGVELHGWMRTWPGGKRLEKTSKGNPAAFQLRQGLEAAQKELEKAV
ncbi:uncharacterized protein C2845_PM11G02520 [Panicum miliaceum]|uniref:Chromo domain-containing protein n=1 Tax=Panicum miliaceum TaxID=4540 RepID=A0A3L6RR84_PANMI|nr:uncharacterized protein C2845_PM11G02520 [Panicum miliaceum]